MACGIHAILVFTTDLDRNPLGSGCIADYNAIAVAPRLFGQAEWSNTDVVLAKLVQATVNLGYALHTESLVFVTDHVHLFAILVG